MLGIGLSEVFVGSAWAQNQQKQVLVLYSTRRDAQIVSISERVLPQILDQAAPEGVDYYSEYIDQARFPDAEYQVALRDFLRLKYEDKQFDLVIAMHDFALKFLASNRDRVFVGAPIVFFAGTPLEVRPPNSTGVVAPLNFSGSIDFALELQPETENVFVVTGADPADQLYEVMVRQQLKPLSAKVDVSYLTGVPTKMLEAQLAKLPRQSIVYYVLVNSDSTGEHFHPLEYLARLSSVANAPIYSWVDSTLNHGIVGGSLKDQEAQTRAMGAIAARVLKGEAADSIPLLTRDLNVKQVDWRQIRRWGISERRIPEGTAIRFRELSVWDRYKVYIVGALIFMLAQAALVVGLLIQAQRRRHAEALARGSQAQLQASYERIRDLGGRLLNAQEDERSRIARELHDDISQQLALLSIDLDMLKVEVPSNAAGLAGEAADRAHAVSKSVHDLSHRLHPAKLRLIGLVPALRALTREMSHPDMHIDVTAADIPPALSPDLTLCMYRVVQEALQNAVKYSHASQVNVHVEGTPTTLLLSVSDDGVGFDTNDAWGNGLGLISMRERIESIGGTIAIRSSQGAGTRLEVRAPLDPDWTAEAGNGNNAVRVVRADSA